MSTSVVISPLVKRRPILDPSLLVVHRHPPANITVPATCDDDLPGHFDGAGGPGKWGLSYFQAMMRGFLELWTNQWSYRLGVCCKKYGLWMWRPQTRSMTQSPQPRSSVQCPQCPLHLGSRCPPEYRYRQERGPVIMYDPQSHTTTVKLQTWCMV